jgi:hypothetical protein
MTLTMDLSNVPRPALLPFAAQPLAAAREIKKEYSCVCSWGQKCAEIQKLLPQQSHDGQPDPRTGNVRTLNLTKYAGLSDTLHTKRENWKKSVETNLNISLESWSEQKLKHVRVARHHWTRAQNAKFDEGTHASKPLPYEEIYPLLEGMNHDKRFSMTAIVGRKEQRLYFNHPNVPLSNFDDILRLLPRISSPATIKSPTAAATMTSSTTPSSIHATPAAATLPPISSPNRMHTTPATANHVHLHATPAASTMTTVPLSTRTNRLRVRHAAAAERQESEQKHRYENLSYEDFCAKENTVAKQNSKIAALNLQLQQALKSIETLQLEKKSQTAKIQSLEICIKKRNKRKAATQANNTSTESSPKKQKFDEDQVIILTESFLVQHGGIQRFCLTNDEWHKRHPMAANDLFGYRTYKEMEIHVCLFFGVSPLISNLSLKKVKEDGSSMIQLVPDPDWIVTNEAPSNFIAFFKLLRA